MTKEKYKNNVSLSKNLLNFFVVFLFFYMPFLKPDQFGYLGYLPFFYLLFFLFYYFLSSCGRTVDRLTFLYLLSFLTFPIYLIVQLFWVDYIDVNIWISSITTYLVLLASLGICSFLSKDYKNKTPHVVIKLLFWAGVLHAVIMLLFYFVHPLRDAVYSFVYISALSEEGSFVESGLRSPGLISSSGDSVSFIQALSFFSGLILFFEEKKRSFIFYILYLTAFTFLFGSLVLSSRTGFLLVFFGFLLYIIYLLFGFSITLKVSLSKFKSFSVILIMSCLIFYIIISNLDALLSSSYSSTVYRAFEAYINWKDGSGFQTSSSNVLLNDMIFLPDTLQQTLFGSGNYGKNLLLPNIPSDSGLILMVFGAGVIGGLLFLFPWLFTIYLVIRAKAEGLYVFYLLALFALFLIMNFKLYQFYGRTFGFEVFALFAASIFICKKYFRE